MKVAWNNCVIAESDDVIIVGSECYFPNPAVRMEYLEKNDEVAYCSDKGYGTYFDLVLSSERIHNGAWSYPHPYNELANIKGRIGFRRSMLA